MNKTIFYTGTAIMLLLAAPLVAQSSGAGGSGAGGGTTGGSSGSGASGSGTGSATGTTGVNTSPSNTSRSATTTSGTVSGTSATTPNTATGTTGTAGTAGTSTGTNGNTSNQGNWNTENTYWRDNFRSRPYSANRNYNDYEPAYRYGVDLYNRNQGKSFDTLNNSDISTGWESSRGTSTMNWNDARAAARDSYMRMYEGRNDRNTSNSATK